MFNPESKTRACVHKILFSGFFCEIFFFVFWVAFLVWGLDWLQQWSQKISENLKNARKILNSHKQSASRKNQYATKSTNNFQSAFTRKNRLRVPSLIRWQFKLEPTQVLKVTITLADTLGVKETFFGSMRKDGCIAAPPQVISC